MSPSAWTVKSPVRVKNGGIETLAFRMAKRTTRPSAALNLMATRLVPTEMVWSTARPVVLICRITSPPRLGTPGSDEPAAMVTRRLPAMPADENTKPPCPSVRLKLPPPTLMLMVASDTATRIALGAGTRLPGLGSEICSKAKLPDIVNGAATDASAKLMPTAREPDRRRKVPRSRSDNSSVPP